MAPGSSRSNWTQFNYEARGREFESLRAYHPYENAWLKSLIIIIRLLAFEVCLGYSWNPQPYKISNLRSDATTCCACKGG